MSESSIQPSFDIDKAAARYLADTLESNWLLRRRDPDFFIDYELEHRSNNEPSGVIAYVQLKGKAASDYNEHTVRVVFETKHLKYYLRDVRLPVFIVVADVGKKQGWYVFAQKLLDPLNGQLDTQDTLTIHVPLTNNLENYPKLLADVHSAIVWMNERYPGSPAAAISLVEKLYNTLDERFRVELTASSKAQHFHVSARKPTPVEFSLKGIPADKVQELTNSFDWGTAVNLSGISLTAKGSKLFETIVNSKASGIAWESSSLKRTTITVVTTKQGKSNYLTLPVEITHGRKGVHIKTISDSCPLSIVLRLPIDFIQNKGELDLRIHPEKWIGKDLISAPWRNEVTAFVRSIRADAATRIEIATDVGAAGLNVTSADAFVTLKENAWWFAVIEEGAKVATKFHLSPKIPAPESINDELIQDIRFALDAADERIFHRPSLRLMHKEDAVIDPKLITDLEAKGELVGMFKAKFPYSLELFDITAPIGYLEIEPMHCRITKIIPPPAGYIRAFHLIPIGSGKIDLRLQRTEIVDPNAGYTLETGNEELSQKL